MDGNYDIVVALFHYSEVDEMKKKILFLGFLIGIFAALMILPASAVELPAADAGCEYCRPTWERVDAYHCEYDCCCFFTTCSTCSEKTVLVYCNHTHDVYSTFNSLAFPNKIYYKCNNCCFGN